MKPILFLIIAALAVAVANLHGADKFTIEEINETTKPMPFSITRVEQRTGEIRLWIKSDNIADVARLLRNGAFEAQSSKGEESITIPLSLWKAVSCKNAGTLHLGYSAKIPANCEVEQIRHYFRAPVTLEKGRDFGIGLDPDFLWLIEKE
jgi:hypothetical protein